MTGPERRAPHTADRAEAADGARSQLPAGRHSLSREFVRGNQEERLLAAVPRALATRDYQELAIGHITGEAGVSRATFYELFDGKRDCVLAAHRIACRRASTRIAIACSGLATWPERVAAGVAEALRFCEDSPHEARLLLVHALGADEELSAQVLATNQLLIELVRRGRAETLTASRPPALIDRALVGGITAIVAEHLIAGSPGKLVDLQPQLVELLLMPYPAFPAASKPSR
jgi:AcrR family transcriptional regulator